LVAAFHRRREQTPGYAHWRNPDRFHFSPVTRVKYAVENTRVGQRTDYDKLIMEIWTDGRITPDDALLQASAILRHHFGCLLNYDDSQVEFDETSEEVSQENTRLKKMLNMSVNEIEAFGPSRELPE